MKNHLKHINIHEQSWLPLYLHPALFATCKSYAWNRQCRTCDYLRKGTCILGKCKFSMHSPFTWYKITCLQMSLTPNRPLVSTALTTNYKQTKRHTNRQTNIPSNKWLWMIGIIFLKTRRHLCQPIRAGCIYASVNWVIIGSDNGLAPVRPHSLNQC